MKLLMRAAIWLAALGIAHLCGWRDYVCVLSGAAPPSAHPHLAAALACAYVVLWLGGALVAPVLLLAAGIEALIGKYGSGARAADHRGPT